MFGLCLLGLIGVWVWYFLVGNKPLPAPPAVVTLSILPFTGDEQFAVGLTSALAQVPGLVTINGAAAKADAILKGTVQNSNDHLRVTAQLIDSKTNFQLWSQTYERNAKDIPALQDEIAKAVLNVLRVPNRSGSAFLLFQSTHHIGYQFLGVRQTLGDHLYIHCRLAQLPRTLAIDPMLPHQDQGVGQKVQRNGQAATLGAHHKLLFF
jgi:hypothetical protein